MSEHTDLSPSELEIAQAYASGATYQTIADTLCIAPSTVRTHLATIYRKLAVSSKQELATRLSGEVSQPRNQSEMTAVISELALSLEEAINREKALSEVLGSGPINPVVPALAYRLAIRCRAVGRQNRELVAWVAPGIVVQVQAAHAAESDPFSAIGPRTMASAILASPAARQGLATQEPERDLTDLLIGRRRRPLK